MVDCRTLGDHIHKRGPVVVTRGMHRIQIFHAVDNDGRVHFQESVLRAASTVASIALDIRFHTVRSTCFDNVVYYHHPACDTWTN